jgi:hypothetical protein
MNVEMPAVAPLNLYALLVDATPVLVTGLRWRRVRALAEDGARHPD